ncbi:MAG TPA: hypothetical protein VFV78_12005 [Vicinamibacterales bacterium]|nr:hypothetical protein [Vicinamibacterales bacterium]
MNRRRLATAILLVVAVSAWTGARADIDAGGQRNPTFAKDIAPLVYTQCMPCHRIGQPSPFPLATYDDVRAKGAEVARAVEARLMPPWLATQGPDFPAIAGDRRLTDRQIKTFATWVAHGMPAGPARDIPMPPSLSSSPWPLGLPDMTIGLPRAIAVPAGGSDDYRNVIVPLDFPADVAISAIDYLPGENSVLRHARFFAAPAELAISDSDPLPGISGLLGSGSLENYGDRLLAAADALLDLGAWTPGMARRFLPEGLALRIPARFVLVIQMHLRPGGIDAIENGRVGLYFAKPASYRFVQPLAIPPAFGIASGLNVPAGQAAFSFSDTFMLPIDVEAVGARGDANLLAQTMTLTAAPGMGVNGVPSKWKATGLLKIADWNADWPESYFFTKPIHVPRGAVLRSAITYDNSASNPRNLFTPPRRTMWGRVPVGEMGTMTLLIVQPAAADATLLKDAVARRLREQLMGRK